MAVTLTGTGGLFTRHGKWIYEIRSANTYLGGGDISAGGLKAVGVSYTDILAQYQSALQYVPDNGDVGLTTGRDAVRAALDSWKNVGAFGCLKTLVEQVNADATLVSLDAPTAMAELIRQMIGSGTIYNADNDIDASTVSAATATVTGITNVGDGKCVASVQRAQDARPNELVYAEVMELHCTGDANSGATARQETFDVFGETAASSRFAYNWPLGSGETKSLTAVDAALNVDGGNLLYNSSFNTFTTLNNPDYWGAALVGAYGTDIGEEATTVFRTGTKCLKFTGTGGGPLSSIAQVFGQTPAVNASGTSTVLKPNTVYHVNFWARKSAGALAGVVAVRLLDSTNTQMTDDAGNNLLVSAAVGALSSGSWTAVNGSFVTPHTLTPTTVVKINVRISTAVTSGESIYVADLALTEGTELYTGGPFAAVFAGATPFLIGDRINLTIANNYAGDFQKEFDRVYDMKTLGLQLPSDTGGGETIADSLIG